MKTLRRIFEGNYNLRTILMVDGLSQFQVRVGMLLLCSLFLSDLYSQEKCLSHVIDQRKMEQDPEYRRQRRLLERKIQDFTIDSKAREGAMVTIPVVFQVIHNGDPVGMNENLSDAQLQAQLAQLNADYGRTNTDAGSTPVNFQDEATNTMIQFCLATMDPNGQATTGIVRTHINTLNNVSENECWNAAYIDQNIVTPLSWNTANYLNIFVVRFIEDDDCQGGQSTLGYATFPNGTTFPTRCCSPRSPYHWVVGQSKSGGRRCRHGKNGNS